MATDAALTQDKTDEQRAVALYPGEPVNFEEWRERSSIKERAAAQAMYTLILSGTSFGPLRNLFDSCFRMYTNQRLTLSSPRSSQIPTGQASEIVDTFVAEFMVKLFKTRPLCSILPRGPEDTGAATSNEKYLQYNDDAMNAFRVWYDLIKTICMYGTGIAKVRWEEKTTRVPVAEGYVELVTYRGPVVDPWFLYDFYPDPRSAHIEDHYPKCTVSWRGWDHFVRNADAGVYWPEAVGDIREFKEMPRGVLDVIGDRVFASEQRYELGFTEDTRNEPDGILTIEWEGWFRPRISDLPVKAIITVANGVTVRAEPTAILTQENSLIAPIMDYVPGQLYGTGLIQKSMPQLHTANLMLNMAITKAASSVRGLRAVKPDALYFPTELDNPVGGNLLIKRDFLIDDVVRPIRDDTVRNDIYNLMYFSMDRGRAGTGAEELKSGRVPKGEQTATESSLVFQQIAQRFQLPLMVVENSGVIPAHRKMFYLNRQFLNPDELARVLGPEAAYIPPITREDLSIDPDFVCLASQRESNRDAAIARLNGAIRNLVPLAQIDPKYKAMIDMFLLRLFEEERFLDIASIRNILGQAPPVPTLETGQGGGQGGIAGMPQPGRSLNRPPEGTSPMAMIKSMSGGMSNRV